MSRPPAPPPPGPGLPPALLRRLGADIRRVVLVANNAHLTWLQVDHVLRDDDLVVLFNNPLPLHLFAHRPNPKLLCFRADFQTGLHWGMPPKPNRFAALAALADIASVCAIATYKAPQTRRFAPAMRALFADRERFCVVPESHPAWADYPPPKSPRDWSMPSSGFLMLRLLLAADQARCARTPGATPLQVVLLGFNPVRGGLFWEGHQWRWERQQIAQTPRVVSIPAFDPKLRFGAAAPPTANARRRQPGAANPASSASLAVLTAASFVDQAAPVTLTHESERSHVLQFAFELVAVYEDGPIDGFVVSLAGPGGTELRPLNPERVPSTDVGRKLGARLPWAHASRHKFNDLLRYNASHPPQALRLYAVRGGALREVLHIALDRAGSPIVLANTVQP